MEWIKAALIRAIKTGAQTLAALIGTGAVGILELDWPQLLSVTATAMVLSILTSVAGVPEVQGGTSPLSISGQNDSNGGENEL